MNSDMTKYVFVIVIIDVIFFLMQFGMNAVALDINDSNVTFYNYNTSLLSKYDATGNYDLQTDISAEIPSGTNTVDTDTNNFFTDTWKTLRGWALDVPGVGLVYNVINAVPRMLAFSGMDKEIVFAFAVLWHTLGIIILITWLKGG